MISALHSALVAPLEIVCYHSPEQDLKNKKRTQLSKHKYKLQVFLRLQTQTCASKSKLSIRVNSMIFSRRLKWKTGRQSKKRNTDKLSDEMSDEMREGRRVDLKKKARHSVFFCCRYLWDVFNVFFLNQYLQNDPILYTVIYDNL